MYLDSALVQCGLGYRMCATQHSTTPMMENSTQTVLHFRNTRYLRKHSLQCIYVDEAMLCFHIFQFWFCYQGLPRATE